MNAQKILEAYRSGCMASLGEAKALPFEVYHDANIFAEERHRVFHSEWVFACAEQQISKPGDYYAFNLADEAIVVLRGQDGEVRTFSNLCRHRGTPLLDEGFGHIDKQIICPYHAWTYTDQGDLKAAPFAKDVSLDKEEHALHKIAMVSWHGLVFVNLADKPIPFESRIEGLDEYLSVYAPERFVAGYTGQEESWSANWKLSVENAIESYHLFKVHAETLETLTPTKQAFYLGGSSEWSLNAGKYVDTRSTLSKWFSGEQPEAYQHYLLVFLPPSFVGILDADSFSWLQILPDGATGCRVQSGGIAQESGTVSQMEKEFNDAFMAEDKAIVERVQRGVMSPSAMGGKLVDMEQILVDFRFFLGSRLFDLPATPFQPGADTELFTQDD